MKQYIYNTSDVGYMDEEWIDYDPENTTDKVISKEDENTLKENEEKPKKV